MHSAETTGMPKVMFIVLKALLLQNYLQSFRKMSLTR